MDENTEAKKNYWCMVALNYAGDTAWVLHESSDCTADLILEEYDLMQYEGRNWASGLAPGLYRLSLAVDIEFDVSVTKSELITQFPPISDDEPDYLDITKKTILDTEATG